MGNQFSDMIVPINILSLRTIVFRHHRFKNIMSRSSYKYYVTMGQLNSGIIGSKILCRCGTVLLEKPDLKNR